MKHITKILIFILAVLLLGGLLAACTPDTPPVDGDHVHEGGEWAHNSFSHWRTCKCGATVDYDVHKGGTATYDSMPICKVCGIEYGEHLHQFVEWKNDSEYHWKVCSCGQKSARGKHTGTKRYDGTAVCTACDVTYTPEEGSGSGTGSGSSSDGNSGTHVHDSISGWYSNHEQHWLWCTCGEKYGYEDHYGGTATVDDYAVCAGCGSEYGDRLPLDLPGVIQGYPVGINAYAYIISCDSKENEIDGFVGNMINRRVSDIVDTFYLPLYWVYYLRNLGYSQTDSVTPSQKQRIHFILDGDTFYAQAYYDVQYTAYDKDGNVIEFSEEHGKNPVGDMLKEKFSDIYDVKTGRVVTENSLIMDGSTSTIPLEVAFRMGYYGETEEVASQKVIHNTTYGSFYNLRDGICDLIFTTPLSAQQRDEAKNRGLDLVEVPICMEAFVFVVNANNPVEELTVQQIKDIYSGKITNWKEVGGPDATIEAFQRNNTSGSQNYMKLFMGDTPLMDPITYITPSDMEGLVEVLASYDNAVNSIGYSVYSYAANMYVDAGKIKFIRVNGIAPTEETMGDMTYPLLNYNYAVYDKNNKNPEIEKMVNWILSDEGQQSVVEGGYVPIQGGKLPGYVIDKKLDLYDAVGTGKEYLAGSGRGISMLTMYPWNINAVPPENYLSESKYFQDQYGNEYPIVYGIKYSINGLENKELESEINDFIAAACAEVEEKFDEACERFIFAYTRKDLYSGYFTLADESKLEGFDTRIVRPSKVEIKGQNGYLSVIVHTGFMSYADDSEFYYRYYTKTATFDLRTGARVEKFSDMFPEGVDFVDKLNDSILYHIDTTAGNLYGPVYHIDGEFIALTEEDVENFTYNSVILPFGSPVASLGFEAEFSANSLASKYCDMRQFFTEEFNGRFYDSKASQYLGSERFVSIGGSDSAGVYYPSDAAPALVKAAKYLAEYVEQFISEDIALKMYHDAGYTNAVRVEYSFPKFLPTKVGSAYYCFEQGARAWENIYSAYDADGNQIFDEKLMVGYEELRKINHSYYFYQDTGEPVIVTLKEGWKESAKLLWYGVDIPFLSKYGDEDVIDIFYIDFWTGECLFTVNGDYITPMIVPIDYIVLN